METSTIVERDFTALGVLFNLVINDMKNGIPIWEDFIIKATKLHSQLKSTILTSTAFLDSFQKIADMATNTRGGTKDIGSALTRMCLRQRSVESHLKKFTSSIMDCLIIPLQDRLEEWKKTNVQLDKEHSKEYKKFRQELKKKSDYNSLNLKESAIYQSQQSIATLKLQKKMHLLNNSNNNLYNTNESIYAQMDLNDKLIHFEQMEKNSVRRALIEERSRYCLFVNYFKNMIEEELLITQETSHLQEVLESLSKLTKDPYNLPVASELVITDLKSLTKNESLQFANTAAKYCNTLTNDLNKNKKLKHYNQNACFYGNTNQHQNNQQLNQKQHNHFHHGKQSMNLNQTPPSSPSSFSSFSSRKSSMCSISSFNSSSSGSIHSHSSVNHYRPHIPALHDIHLKQNNVSSRFNSLSQINCGLHPTIPSIASHDSGFMSNADYSLPQVSCLSEHSSNTSSTSSMPSTDCWSNNNTSSNVVNENCYISANTNSSRPHTISNFYKQKQIGHHNRPSITTDTFEPIYNISTMNSNKNFNSQHNQLTLNQKENLYSKSITENSTVIKVETTSSNIINTNSSQTKINSIKFDQQKCINDLGKLINGDQNLDKNIPPTPPARKFSLQSEYQKLTDNMCIKNLNQQINNHLLKQNSKMNSETSINQSNINSTKLEIIDDGTVTLTRHNSSNNQNNPNKLSSSLKSVLFINEDEKKRNFQLNGQLSLINLSNNNNDNNNNINNNNNNNNINNINKTKSVPPPPPIRRTSSISNPNAITLATLKNAGISTYEEIKNLNQSKKNTINYATYEDISKLGINFVKNLNSSVVSNQNCSNLNTKKLDHYEIYSSTSNNYLNNHESNEINLNSSQNPIYNDLAKQTDKNNDNTYLKNEEIKSDEKEKSIYQLRSEYQQAKNLFENLQSNQYQTKIENENNNSNSNLISKSSEIDNYSINKINSIDMNNHVSRMSTIKKEFIETLNAKLSSPNIKNSTKFNKRRSLSVGPNIYYDFDPNSALSHTTSVDQTNKLSNESSNNGNNHFSFQQSLLKLVTNNYAKITRSPEITRKKSSSINYHIYNKDNINSLINNSSNNSLLLTTNTSTNSVNSLSLGVEVAKEVASIAIKKKQNSYPVACGNYEILDVCTKKEPIYSSGDSVTNNSVHTTTIQVESSNFNSSNGQEIYQPVHNLQIKSNINQQNNNISYVNNNVNQKRFSQPNMGVKIVTNIKQQTQQEIQQQTQQQQQQQQKSNFMYYSQSQVQDNFHLINANNQKSGNEINQNLDFKDNFLTKSDSKSSSINKTNSQNLLNTNKDNICFGNAVAERVENWLNKSLVDQNVSRENLMDQIRKGIKLRKVNNRNDRSAPKL